MEDQGRLSAQSYLHHLRSKRANVDIHDTTAFRWIVPRSEDDTGYDTQSPRSSDISYRVHKSKKRAGNDESTSTVASLEFVPLLTSAAVEKGYRDLKFKPMPFRALVLGSSLPVFAACIITIIFFIRRFQQKPAGVSIIHDYRYHIMYQYLPAAIGTGTSLWWQCITTSYGHMTPYMILADAPDYKSEEPPLEKQIARITYSCTLLYPQFSFTFLVVPLKALFIQSLPDSSNNWTVHLLPEIGWALVAIYVLLFLTTSAILTEMWKKRTGLKWGPVSIADRMALVQGSNILPSFQGQEFAEKHSWSIMMKRCKLILGRARLGYWMRNGEVWYGLALDSRLKDINIGGSSVKNEANNQYCSRATASGNLNNDLSERSLGPHGEDILNPWSYRYRNVFPVHAFWKSFVWATITFLSIILATVVMVLNKTHWFLFFQNTLSSTTFVSLTLIGPFVPVCLMMAYRLYFADLDLYYRKLEPFAELDRPCSAESSLLLDYQYQLPFEIVINTFQRKHWRTGFAAILALLSTIPPIIAAGIVSVRPGTHNDSWVAHVGTINLIIIFVVKITYLIAIIALRPATFFDIIHYCYNSRVLDEVTPDRVPVFSAQGVDELREHMVARIILAHKKYVFGLYLGKDGRRHTGFDVDKRTNEMGTIQVLVSDHHVCSFGSWFMRKVQENKIPV